MPTTGRFGRLLALDADQLGTSRSSADEPNTQRQQSYERSGNRAKNGLPWRRSTDVHVKDTRHSKRDPERSNGKPNLHQNCADAVSKLLATFSAKSSKEIA